MSNTILLLGDSGTGKSTSLRNLPPEQTFILSVIGKPLPFRGASKNYTRLSADGKSGNFYVSDNAHQVARVIQQVNAYRPEIKYFILDDLGYLIMNAFMRRALVKGYDRFSEIASEFGIAIAPIENLRDDLFFIASMHIETDKQGKTKPKTIGNMIDQYVCIEGKFNYIFHTAVIDGKYKFITNNDGVHMAKSSFGLFDQVHIDNDLKAICDKITEFLNEDINL